MRAGQRLCYFLLHLLISPASILADEGDVPFKLETEMGYINISGNSRTETLNTATDFRVKLQNGVSLSLKGDALFGKSDGRRSAERYGLKIRAMHDLGRRFFALIKLGWDRNRFSGVENRVKIGGGAGYKWLTGKRHALKTTLGFNYIREEQSIQRTKISPTPYISATYGFKPVEAVTLGQFIKYPRDTQIGANWEWISDSSLRVELSPFLAIRISQKISYRNLPVSGFDRRDSLHSTDLIFIY